MTHSRLSCRRRRSELPLLSEIIVLCQFMVICSIMDSNDSNFGGCEYFSPTSKHNPPKREFAPFKRHNERKKMEIVVRGKVLISNFWKGFTHSWKRKYRNLSWITRFVNLINLKRQTQNFYLLLVLILYFCYENLTWSRILCCCLFARRFASSLTSGFIDCFPFAPIFIDISISIVLALKCHVWEVI